MRVLPPQQAQKPAICMRNLRAEQGPLPAPLWARLPSYTFFDLQNPQS